MSLPSSETFIGSAEGHESGVGGVTGAPSLVSATGSAGPSGQPAAAIDLSYDVDSEGFDDESDGVDDPSDLEPEADATMAISEAAVQMFTDEEADQMLEMLTEKGMVAWLKEYVIRRQIPVRQLLLELGIHVNRPPDPNEDMVLLPFLKVTLTRILRRRPRLSQYSTVDDVLNLLRNCKRIIVLSGAGISVSCGIPDFRSATGLYAMLQREGKYQLDDPQQMFDITYFKENPMVFYSFASRIYPSNFVPSPCHRFIKLLEDRGTLLRNYTQNIDALETSLGVKNVLQCHGSFATASCIQCRRQVPGSEISTAIFAQQIPYCSECSSREAQQLSETGGKKPTKKSKKGKAAKPWEQDESEGETDPLPIGATSRAIMKPDITFFGEALTDRFDKCLDEDREVADLLIVMGTSLKVAPVSEILTHLPHSVPQILINKTPVTHVNPDVVLLGDADGIVRYLCGRLGWSLPGLSEAQAALPAPTEPRRVGQSHVWTFDGAVGGEWVKQFEDEDEEPPAPAPSLIFENVPSVAMNPISRSRSRENSDDDERGSLKKPRHA